LSYGPQNQNYDGRFREVEVKVKAHVYPTIKTSS